MPKLLSGLAVYAALTMPVLADEAMICVQQVLNDLGYAAGPVDGAIGGRTRAAAALLAADAGLDLPDLAAETGAQWCQALTAFAETDEARTLQSPARSVIPGDILLQLPAIAAGPGGEFCGTSNPASAGALTLEPFDRITGFSSRMSNIAEVENARPLEKFAAAFGGQAVAAYASGNIAAQKDLIALFAKWAEADALLGTEDCVRGNGELVTTGVCTEWTVDDGSDPSAMKDATFVTFIGAGLVRVYYATLSDVAAEELASEHAAIKGWIEKWSDRLKRPGNVYFGLNMGWYWPTIANEIARGDLDSARSRLTRIADTMIGLIKDDGSIVERTTRGNRAIWYHYTSLGEVVMSMELMRAAGMMPPPALEAKLHKAVRLFIEAVKDHDFIDKWARVANNSIYDGTQDWDRGGWMHSTFAGTWLLVYPYRYAGVPEAEELRSMVGRKAGAAVGDIDLGLPLGCLYEAASSLRGLEIVEAEPAAPILPLTAKSVTIYPQYSDDNFTEYLVSLGGVVLGEENFNGVPFSVYTDYDGNGKSPDNLDLLRMVFNRAILRDQVSRTADYSACGDLAVQVEGSGQMLRLHFGREQSLNACILEKMGATDRALLSAIHQNFAELVAAARGDDAATLGQMLAAME